MKTSGFTMVELLITLFITVIIMFIGIPSFKQVISSSNMISNSNDMLSAFNYARMEAVKRGDTVRLGQRDGSSWTGGLVVWVDADANLTLDTSEELRLWEPFNNGISMVSTNNLTIFSFNASGESSVADVLTLCDDRSDELGRTISVLISGSVFVEELPCD